MAVPARVDLAKLRASLERVASDLMVEVKLQDRASKSVDKSFDAILFDNDGVLVDTEGSTSRPTARRSRFDVALDRAAYVELFHLLMTPRAAWDLLRDRASTSPRIEECAGRRDQRHQATNGRRRYRRRASPRYRSEQRSCAGRSSPSSRPAPFKAVHARAGIRHHFELALTRKRGIATPSPIPSRTSSAASRLGVSPAPRCLVIEDSERGLRAAVAAGIACWVVPSELTRGGCFDDAAVVLGDFAAVVRRLLED